MLSKNLIRARISIRGTRPLLQHAFTEYAIPLEAQERTGVAGNDPEEWRRTKMVTADGQLYLTAENAFSCLRDGAKFTKKGRASIQGMVAATLQVEQTLESEGVVPQVSCVESMPSASGHDCSGPH